ncbi:hypothetical protein [Streptomyces collinus]|uniref:hypothetical protein n=1 Tax=Streptomyces collinus TaxID=42684 RepID=UPI0036389B29
MFALGHEGMKRRLPALVVAGWVLVNGPFLAVLAIHGESAPVYWLWGGAVLVLELFAVATLLSSRTGPEGPCPALCAVTAPAPSYVPAGLRGRWARRPAG